MAKMRDTLLLILRVVGFYVGLPIIFSLHSGIFQTGFGQYLPLQFSIYFWASSWLFTWWIAEVALFGLTKLLRPWNVALAFRILVAGAISVWISRYYTPVLLTWFAQFGHDIPLARFVAGQDFITPSYLMSLFSSGAPAFIAWVLSRLLYNSIYKEKPSRQQPPLPKYEMEPSTEYGEPEKTSKINPKLGVALTNAGIHDPSQILALRAEDHYVRVILQDRSELILCKFADVVDGLSDQDGLRIHRSYWVSRTAVKSVRQRGGSQLIEIMSGDEVPISLQYRAMFEHWYRKTHQSSV